MARIRSIKPEFWTDGKIASLPKSTALFFIALWNFADDQGIISNDARTLSLQVPIYRSQDIHKMLNALCKAGLIKRSACDGLVLINGWKHQKIDKPRDGKYKVNEIEWVEYDHSTTVRESSSNIRRKDRIGEDTRGSDRIVANESENHESQKTEKAKKPTADSASAEIGKQASEVISRYCELWKAKYNTSPAFSQKWAGNAKTLVKDHGVKKSIQLVESFLEMTDSYFIQRRHSFEIILTSLAQIAHFAGTGVQMQKTSQPFNRAEARTNANRDAMEKYLSSISEEQK